MYEKYVILRNKKKVTDYRVSEETGITKSTFTDWKSGRSNPKFDKLLVLAKYFGVSVEYFAEEKETD
ncbi:helix-turn-helix transcriptional regulator [Blautia coccoides]|uniref:helix-turn-helix domain-containing protein n=1 Tax=Blautia producta TaxID=33035 RepID=UPI0028A402F7|nr:helix-turn-helix transcriptional regulator [Blautia coccoides]MDT4373026.1 helix-turn-helix transcriptional regulator [Blautia coccoides]